MKKFLFVILLSVFFLGPFLILPQHISAQQNVTDPDIKLGTPNLVDKKNNSPQCQLLANNDDHSVSATIKCSSLISDVWTIFLGFVDAGALAFFIAIAFATILHIQYDTYGVKKALPALILGLVMAHFSLFICRMIVDFSQVAAATFYNGAAITSNSCSGFSNGSDFIACNLTSTIFTGLGKTIAGSGGAAQATTGIITWVSGGFFFITIWIVLALILLPTALILILSLELYLRLYILMFLAMIAPIAWLAIMWGPIQGAFKKWWGEYVRWALVAPLILFYLWLSITIYIHTTTGGVTTNATTGVTTSTVGDATFGTYLLSVFMLWLAVKAPGALGGAIGGTVSGIATNLATKGTKGAVSGAWNTGNNISDAIAARDLKGGGNVGSRTGYGSLRSKINASNKYRGERAQTWRDKSEGNYAKIAGTGPGTSLRDGLRSYGNNTNSDDGAVKATFRRGVGKFFGNPATGKAAGRLMKRDLHNQSSGNNDRTDAAKDYKENYDTAKVENLVNAQGVGRKEKLGAGLAAAAMEPDQKKYEGIRDKLIADKHMVMGGEEEQQMHQERLMNNHGREVRTDEEARALAERVMSPQGSQTPGAIATAQAMTTAVVDQTQMDAIIAGLKGKESLLSSGTDVPKYGGELNDISKMIERLNSSKPGDQIMKIDSQSDAIPDALKQNNAALNKMASAFNSYANIQAPNESAPSIKDLERALKNSKS